MGNVPSGVFSPLAGVPLFGLASSAATHRTAGIDPDLSEHIETPLLHLIEA